MDIFLMNKFKLIYLLFFRIHQMLQDIEIYFQRLSNRRLTWYDEPRAGL